MAAAAVFSLTFWPNHLFLRNKQRAKSSAREQCMGTVDMADVYRPSNVSNYNRASVRLFVCMFVCGYVHVFLLDGLQLGRQTFRD